MTHRKLTLVLLVATPGLSLAGALSYEETITDDDPPSRSSLPAAPVVANNDTEEPAAEIRPLAKTLPPPTPIRKAVGA